MGGTGEDGPMAGGTSEDRVALVLGGGGARAAYQVGLLRCLAEIAPDHRFPIVTGVSAGGMNAVYLASHPAGLADATEGLRHLWHQLTVDRVVRTGGLTMARNALRWGARLLSGGSRIAPEVRGLLDTAPLASTLAAGLQVEKGRIPGLARNLEAGHLHAIALTTLDYGTGHTTTWVQGCGIPRWERADRCSVNVHLSTDHVMASAALPLFFPAVRLGDSWHGDGGVRMAAPLAPAIHLGATRILTVSTRHRGSAPRGGRRYPPPAQILGTLVNAAFLDSIDQDAERLERINRLVRALPPQRRDGLRDIQMLVIRPSVDLGELAQEYESELPRSFRFMTRGLGTRESRRPDFLSLLMFHPEYTRRVIEIGEADAWRHCEMLRELVLGAPRPAGEPLGEEHASPGVEPTVGRRSSRARRRSASGA